MIIKAYKANRWLVISLVEILECMFIFFYLRKFGKPVADTLGANDVTVFLLSIPAYLLVGFTLVVVGLLLANYLWSAREQIKLPQVIRFINWLVLVVCVVLIVCFILALLPAVGIRPAFLDPAGGL